MFVVAFRRHFLDARGQPPKLAPATEHLGEAPSFRLSCTLDPACHLAKANLARQSNRADYAIPTLAQLLLHNVLEQANAPVLAYNRRGCPTSTVVHMGTPQRARFCLHFPRTQRISGQDHRAGYEPPTLAQSSLRQG